MKVEIAHEPDDSIESTGKPPSSDILPLLNAATTLPTALPGSVHVAMMLPTASFTWTCVAGMPAAAATPFSIAIAVPPISERTPFSVKTTLQLGVAQVPCNWAAEVVPPAAPAVVAPAAFVTAAAAGFVVVVGAASA